MKELTSQPQMIDATLVLNAGSSSLKFSVFQAGDSPSLLLHGQISGLHTEPLFVACDAKNSVLEERAWPPGSTLSHEQAIERLWHWTAGRQCSGVRLTAAGHRVVHGGREFVNPVRVDDRVLAGLDALVPLAPLHQPHNIAAIRAVARHSPALPQVACFDTAFHASQPSVARLFGLPREYSDAGVVRYGFHGLSYEYIASRLPQVDAKAAGGRTVVAHLGNGASLCAMKAGKSVATTMGFTPLDGLVMGTRCGAIDPGALLYLMTQRGLDPKSLDHTLTFESGLLGVSQVSSDMRTLLDQENSNPRAAEAIELFVYRIARELGSMAAALSGIDALVFTGGIGEHSAAIRARVCHAARWLGVECDEKRNESHGPSISADSSSISAWVIPTNEELVIAQQTMQLLFEV